MNITECIKTRRSIRKYLDVPVPWDFIGDIVDSARLAPSAGNLQNWKFIIVLEKSTRKKISEASLQQYWMETAPVHIVVCAEPVKAIRYYGMRGDRLYSIQNCAAAIENMLLVAHSLGLGACWVGAFEEEMLKRILGIPDDVRPQAIITIGYPDEKVPEPINYTIENVVYLERFGNRIRNFDAVMEHYGAMLHKRLARSKESLSKVTEKIAKKLSEKGKEAVSKLKEKVEKK